jgi:NAD(P)-dependent dehydrogenase (short-subunit alcohol dehydrogenase family)
MKTVIITGASGNLGTAVTSEFLNKGYRVVATVHSEKAKAEFEKNDNLHIEIIDLTNEEASSSFVHSTIEKFGPIHAAMLLVGGFAMGNLESTKADDVQKQIDLNFFTAFNLVKPLHHQMKENGFGRIVLVGSRPALVASTGKDMVAYTLAKSLLFKFAELLNQDAKGKNVTATVIVPSTIDTPANRNSMPNANPSNWVKPQEIAGILEFIVSEQASSLREPVLKIYNNA